jgi:hypothetical protein
MAVSGHIDTEDLEEASEFGGILFCEEDVGGEAVGKYIPVPTHLHY